MKLLASLAALVVIASGCATSSTVFVGPACASKVSVDGGTPLTARAVVIEHGLDLPFRSRDVVVQYPDGRQDKHRVTSDHIDPYRLAIAGTLFLGGAAYASLALSNNDPAAAPSKTTAAAFGVVVGVLGGMTMATGWTPQQTSMFDVGKCEDAAPSSPAPSSAAPSSP